MRYSHVRGGYFDTTRCITVFARVLYCNQTRSAHSVFTCWGRVFLHHQSMQRQTTITVVFAYSLSAIKHYTILYSNERYFGLQREGYYHLFVVVDLLDVSRSRAKSWTQQQHLSSIKTDDDDGLFHALLHYYYSCLFFVVGTQTAVAGSTPYIYRYIIPVLP